ncbi:acylphosphatase [Desulfobacula sp.]
MPNEIQIKVIVSGRVQGVFFRVHTKDKADRLGLKGYVKNLANGSVQGVFKGEKDAVTRMIEWCHKGPATSKVENVLTTRADGSFDFTRFDIRY